MSNYNNINVPLVLFEANSAYYPKAKATCGCGKAFVIGSTVKDIKVEICSNCHPFYTGKEKLVDTAGKVEKFKARRAKAAAMPKKPGKKEKRVKRTVTRKKK